MVAAVGVFCAEECINEVESQTDADYALTEAKHVRIVMLACKSCGENVRAASRTDTLVLVSRDGHSNARAADEDAELTFARKHLLASGRCKYRIVTACRGESSRLPRGKQGEIT